MLGKRHGFAGHGFVGSVRVFGVEMRGLRGLGSPGNARSLQLGLPALVAARAQRVFAVSQDPRQDALLQ